ncbi:hypothetical protein N7528_006632 [Penicillium herquei]|nr:hypothetical protein N7528_006632 [Penicillium herquei]
MKPFNRNRSQKNEPNKCYRVKKTISHDASSQNEQMKRKLFIFRAQEQTRERSNRKSVSLSSLSSVASPPTNTESKRGHPNTCVGPQGHIDFQMQSRSQGSPQAQTLQVKPGSFLGALSDRGIANFVAPPGPGTGGTVTAKSSSYRNSSPFTLTQDGIQKEHTTFKIPAELKLSNINQLISQATKEKEFKDLDSRQRKKLYMGKLEKKERHYMYIIAQLEDAVANLQKREAEIISVHTLETAELRKKNTILLEAIEKLEQGSKPPIADRD